jgi:hypothetical protein
LSKGFLQIANLLQYRLLHPVSIYLLWKATACLKALEGELNGVQELLNVVSLPHPCLSGAGEDVLRETIPQYKVRRTARALPNVLGQI